MSTRLSKIKLNQFTTLTGVISINDLREMDYSRKPLSNEQKRALQNFDAYRIEKLNGSKNENEFHMYYLKLQALANLAPYHEFLKEDYTK